MPRVLCTLENASTEISGVKFEAVEGGMLSEDVSDEVAAHFLSIEGYEPADGAPAPAKAPAPAPKQSAAAKTSSKKAATAPAPAPAAPAPAPVEQAPATEKTSEEAPQDPSAADTTDGADETF